MSSERRQRIEASYNAARERGSGPSGNSETKVKGGEAELLAPSSAQDFPGRPGTDPLNGLAKATPGAEAGLEPCESPNGADETPERHIQLQQIFEAAVNLPEPQRSAYLDQACAGDPSLRDRLKQPVAADVVQTPPVRLAVMECPKCLRCYESPQSACPRDESILEFAFAGPRLVDGKYLVEQRLGRGGMGTVYRARDMRLGRDVALKVTQERFSARFEREARAIAALNHPNICTLYDVGPNYLVMELVEGETLKSRLGGQPLQPEMVVDLSIQLADALDAAHSKKIIHRDIKPANILITGRGQVKILDFGLAKLKTRGTLDSRSSTLDIDATDPISAPNSGTVPGLVLGTPSYMSPEQACGDEVDARSDLFSLGAVIYEMATGLRSFDGESTATILRAVLQKEPVPPSTLNPKLPPGLDEIVGQALAKERDKRHSNAAEIRTALEQLKHNSERFWPAGKGTTSSFRNRWTIVAAGVAMLALGAAGWLYRTHPVHALNDSDTVLLADFTNSTGDSAFDETLQPALEANLQESPFLSVLPDQMVKSTLKLMGQPPDIRMTADVARQVCIRAGSKAYFGGSIASLGSVYVVGLKAVNCRTGESLAQAEETAKRKEEVLSAVHKATNDLREKVGESLASIKRVDLPLDVQQSTTPSLEAWQNYSFGRKVLKGDNIAASINFFQRAIQLDQNFAMAQLSLGIAYFNLGEADMSTESIRKAFALRDRVSEWERFAIESRYYRSVEGDLIKARSVYETWALTYPRDPIAVGNLAEIDDELGDYQKAVAEARLSDQLDPEHADACDVISYNINANLLQAAESVAEQELKKHPNDICSRGDLYLIAFIQHDSAGMARQSAWAEQQGVKDFEPFELQLAAYRGQLAKARQISERAVATAQRQNQKEVAADTEAEAGLREALFGNFNKARKLALDALDLSRGRDAQYMAALVFALVADTERAQNIVQYLGTHVPEDTIVHFNSLPTVKALLAMDRGRPAEALEDLQAAVPYELGQIVPALLPVYARGQAYLAAHQGVEAEGEFKKILNHRGVIVNQSLGLPIDALAHLGLGRAYAIAGDTAKARGAYQDFFTIWKDADAGIPVLEQAQSELKELK